MTLQPPIADYGLIGDGRSAALVSRSGSVDWLCWPRFDSPSLLGRLLDPDSGGYWRIAPQDATTSTRKYIGATNVLETCFQTDSGVALLTDFMPVATEREQRRRIWPEHELLRYVACVQGEVQLAVEFAPRPNYGRRRGEFRDAGGLGHRLDEGSHLITLRSEAPLESHSEQGLVGRFRLKEGESLAFSLSYSSDGPAALPPLGELARQRLALTLECWNQWSQRCRYAGPYRDEVLRSALALKLLTFTPSGAVIAAPTASLPERIGGDLNWDYRFCWLRDAAFTVRVFLALGFDEEAEAFLSWLLHATRLTQPRLRVLYDVYGETPPQETSIAWLTGYRNSRPVRLGNSAEKQFQLDLYGEVIDAAAAWVESGRRLDRETQRILREFGEFVAVHWQEPDSGLWEPRGERQPYTHSRLMCWVALDRLIAMHRSGHLGSLSVESFVEQAQRIQKQLLDRAWNNRLQAYTQTVDGDRVDASALAIALHQFEQPDSSRMLDTAKLLQARLGAGPGLMYRNEDSLTMGEGAFVMCSFWWSDFLARGGGTLNQARTAFEAALQSSNDLGLFAEEVDPQSGEALGNFPQAFSHVGLVNAALSLARRQQQQDPGEASDFSRADRPETVEESPS